MKSDAEKASHIHKLLENIQASNASITGVDIAEINELCDMFIKDELPLRYLDTIKEIIILSNILYNNTTNDILPLEDGQYDLIVAKYNKLTNGLAPVGAPSTNIKNSNFNVTMNDSNVDNTGLIDAVVLIPEDKRKYLRNIMFNNNPYIKEDDIISSTNYSGKMNKLIREAKTPYPELVGTLHKCKFVTLGDALQYGVKEDDPSVMIFDRDFLNPTFYQALSYSANGCVEMIVELKYDGVSVEAVIEGDHIVNAYSRGDTANEVSSDLTPIFGGMKFKRAFGMNNDFKFGMKFEAIITADKLNKLEQDFDIHYKNPRVAVSGLLSNNSAPKFRDYITLVPIKTAGISFPDIKSEIDWMNKYYSSGVEMRYALIYGRNETEISSQVLQFLEEADYMRSTMNFAYDGIVVSYTNENMKMVLGRKNSIDGWSMAVKFNAKSKNTFFLGYDFSIGQDGRITPIGYFASVEFFGTSHNKTTIHSYKRFNELSLREGDIVNIKYVNDVICYLSKPNISYNDKIDSKTEPIPFPSNCPSCGDKLYLSDSGDSAWCYNPNCPEKVISRVSGMVKKLGIKDFGRNQLDKLGIYSFTDFLNIDYNKASFIIGKKMSDKLLQRINKLKTEPIEDYKILGAIGFNGISQSRWKNILSYIKLEDIVKYTDNDLKVAIINIPGCSDSIADVIIFDRKNIFKKDLKTILSMNNIIVTYGTNYKSQLVVRFSGIRDPMLEKELQSRGIDADGNKGVSKNTNILIVPFKGYSSSKVSKVISYNASGKSNCSIMTIDEFINYIKN